MAASQGMLAARRLLASARSPAALQTRWLSCTPARNQPQSPVTKATAGKLLAKHDNCRVELHEGGVAVVHLDQAGSKVNTLSKAMSDEFFQVMRLLETNAEVRAAVIISAKDNDFIAGADINMFTQCKTKEDMINISKPAQEIFAQLENGKPTVAAINGSCLGGGLELALACTYRIASTSSKTKFGLPEVKLGLLPGAGGTQRLPKLVGLDVAMPMMLMGGDVRPAKAKKIKLVDQVADKFALEHAAIQAAKALADGTLKPVRGPQGVANKLKRMVLEDTEFGRNFVCKKAREQVLRATNGNYPSPLRIIDVLKLSAEKGFGSADGYRAEYEGFAELGMTPESDALVSLFFGMTDAKKNPFGKPKTEIKTVGVLGAGLMGAGIAEVTVKKNHRVLLKDAFPEGLAKGLDTIQKDLSLDVKKRKLTEPESQLLQSNVVGLVDSDPFWPKHFEKADLIIEAVPEILELKHSVIKDIESKTPKHCIFASNTSSIPITKLAEASSRPDKFVGMHYFSPVPKMMLIEIIPTEKTSKDTLAAAYAMGVKQGKLPIVVKDVAGFFVNRCLGPYSDEGLALLQNGADIKTVDKALKDFGFPVGPMSLVDEVGMDIAAKVALNLKDDLKERVGASDDNLIAEVMDSGFLGRKTGGGMFLYPKTKKKGPKEVNPAVVDIINKYRREEKLIEHEHIQMRMVSRFVNEAALCLQDEIITGPTVGDVGSVFGIGFAPFRGGPFRFLDSYGAQKFVDRMLMYRDELGAHFEPAQILKDYAAANKKFHSS